MKMTMPENNLRQFLEKINTALPAEKNVPMAEFSTFECGGNADWFFRPDSLDKLSLIKQTAFETGVQLFILGKGANILVSDLGIREPVVLTDRLNAISQQGTELVVQAGCDVDELCDRALELELSGLEFIAGLPGTLGGAIWMNARCYGASIADRLTYVDYLDETGSRKRLIPDDSDFAYKQSPFQNKEWIIIEAGIRLKAGDYDQIQTEMREKRDDREKKGHFRFPCAGSVFKNNRDFGQPSGQIIDSLGLRGTRIGKAMISDFHANIIVNPGGAKAADIYSLIRLARDEVSKKKGFHLEPEVLLVGDWTEEERRALTD